MYIITIRIIIIRQLLNLNKFRQVSELYEIAPMGPFKGVCILDPKHSTPQQ